MSHKCDDDCDCSCEECCRQRGEVWSRVPDVEPPTELAPEPPTRYVPKVGERVKLVSSPDAQEALTLLEEHVHSLRMAVEIAQQREPTQAEGDAHAHRPPSGAPDDGGDMLDECFVPAGGWPGRICRVCRRWVWGGPTACVQCLEVERLRKELVAEKDAHEKTRTGLTDTILALEKQTALLRECTAQLEANAVTMATFAPLSFAQSRARPLPTCFALARAAFEANRGRAYEPAFPFEKAASDVREYWLHVADAVLALLQAPPVESARTVRERLGWPPLTQEQRDANLEHNVGIAPPVEPDNTPPDPLPEVLPVGTKCSRGNRTGMACLSVLRLQRDSFGAPVYRGCWWTATDECLTPANAIDWAHYRSQQKDSAGGESARTPVAAPLVNQAAAPGAVNAATGSPGSADVQVVSAQPGDASLSDEQWLRRTLEEMTTATVTAVWKQPSGSLFACRLNALATCFGRIGRDPDLVERIAREDGWPLRTPTPEQSERARLEAEGFSFDPPPDIEVGEEHWLDIGESTRQLSTYLGLGWWWGLGVTKSWCWHEQPNAAGKPGAVRCWMRAVLPKPLPGGPGPLADRIARLEARIAKEWLDAKL